MNVKEIKEIVNLNNVSDDIKESLIIKTLASDEKIIPLIMDILNTEREQNKDLLTDMNLELSRAHIYIDERPESKVEGKDPFNKGFILDKISEFYIKYKENITHCFNRFN